MRTAPAPTAETTTTTGTTTTTTTGTTTTTTTTKAATTAAESEGVVEGALEGVDHLGEAPRRAFRGRAIRQQQAEHEALSMDGSQQQAALPASQDPGDEPVGRPSPPDLLGDGPAAPQRLPEDRGRGRRKPEGANRRRPETIPASADRLEAAFPKP
jgi:hypothetical protein